MKKVWKKGDIDGVIVKPVPRIRDARGWLFEGWRKDWCSVCLKPAEVVGDNVRRCSCGGLNLEYVPAMAYVSATDENVVRGPHEHKEQVDYFVFVGSFVVRLWDARRKSKTFGRMMTFRASECCVVVPPGVVHCYCSRADNQIVLNLPDVLYAGHGRTSNVDEIRHENEKHSPYDVSDLKGW